MEFGEHVKPRCARFKAQKVGLATLRKLTICGHSVDDGGDCIHVDGGEVCGLWFIVIWVVELAETFVDIVSTVLEDNS